LADDMALDQQSQAFVSNLVQSVSRVTLEAVQAQNREFSNAIQTLATKLEAPTSISSRPIFDLRGVNLSLPNFDGTQDVKQWLVNLEDFITVKNISKTDCRMVFRLATSGIARQYLDKKLDLISFEDLSLAFKDRFTPKGQEYRIREQLFNLHMQRGNLEQYINDFEFLIQQCSNMHEIDKLFAFRQGLPRNMAIELVAKDVKTLEEAYKLAYAFATARNLCPVPSCFRPPSNQLPGSFEPMDLDRRKTVPPSSNKQKSRTSRSPQRTPRSRTTSNSGSTSKTGKPNSPRSSPSNKTPDFNARRRDNRCYNCGKPGHFSNDCKSPCGYCNKPGHTSKNCFQRQKDKKTSSSNDNKKQYNKNSSKWKISDTELEVQNNKTPSKPSSSSNSSNSFETSL
jgi:hypothetical protein